MTPLHRTLTALSAARTSHQAAEQLARQALSVVASTLAEQQPALQARVGHAQVHLRPECGYRGLWTFHADDPGAPSEALVPSATAWQLLRETGRPVRIEVGLRRLEPEGGEPVPYGQGDASRSGGSLMALERRDTTHVYAAPLVQPGGRIVGMLAIEVSCTRALGRGDLLWDPVAQELTALARAAGPWLLGLPLAEPPAPGRSRDRMLPVIGERMAALVATLEVFSRMDETLLLRGETGTGKSHLARWCYRHSRRRAGPFEAVNLHTLPETLREGHLFGWKRNAFTGAARDHRGHVQLAEGGTLFIDEVDKLPLSAQGKLLYLLEERRYKPLGAEREVQADVRFIVGSNADLEKEVAEGRFLKDLYYRVAVLPAEVPPLRERVDEIPGWAGFMAQQAFRRSGGEGRVDLTTSAGLRLGAEPWPGNLRQLKNVVVRAVAFASIGSEPAADLTLDDSHVERALALDVDLGREGLGGCLQRAAGAFVTEALRRRERGLSPLALEHCDAFTGYVLTTAVQQLGDDKEAFRLFGLEKRLKGGNHLQTLRREQGRVEALQALLA